MNQPSEFELYRQLQDAETLTPTQAEASERRARMGAELDAIATVLREAPEPSADLLVARVRRALAAAKRRQQIRAWLRVSAAAALLLMFGMVGTLWWHPIEHNAQQPLPIAAREQLQGQAQLLILVEQQPERFALQASLARELLHSQVALTEFAERTNHHPLQRHCTQMDAILRLLANAHRPLPEGIRDEIRDSDLRFHAEALALAANART